MNRIIIALTVSSALALGACKKEPPESTPPPPADVVTAPTPMTPTNTANMPGSQSHFAAAMSGADTIYFETDRYNIDNDDMAALRRQAEYMIQYPSARATVEGHADERGTRDYNLALGERRANAARNYLVSLGVADNRLSTVSYGEERPVATGSNDSAWQRNRRSVTVMMSR